MKGQSLLGVLFTVMIAVGGTLLALLPGLSFLGAMLISIFVAVIYRNLFGYPEALQSGIDFVSKKILRLAIILYGFNLNMNVIFTDGLSVLFKSMLVILIAFALILLLAKWLRADLKISILLAAGTGVCGAAAIAAVSPVIQAKDEDTAMSVGLIALAGTLFAVVYTLMYSFMNIQAALYGQWAGLSLHEIAHVVAAASPAGAEALSGALFAKMGRVIMIVPLCIILSYWIYKRAGQGSAQQGKKSIAFPWFILGFVLTSLAGTFLNMSEQIVDVLTTGSSFLLTMAMAGLGLNVSFKALKNKALKPALAMMLTSAVISVVVFMLF